jgi:predicted acyl esterase
MKKISFAVLAAAAACATAPGAALAAGTAYPDADWTQASIPVDDTTTLHADVLLPKGLGDQKVPVIVSIGPYFGHAGQTGASCAIEGCSYDPVGPSSGPSERFQDFVDGAKLFTRDQKYAFVMVDLRGYGGSTGCLDWGGPGEQADVVKAIEWAAGQDWSTGKVGTYGKSYDGMTGLMGAASRPEPLKAVVAQEPVYDNYRYLYGDGIRRLNSVLTPALYDSIAATPGPLADADPAYQAANLQDNLARPGCLAANWLDQAGNDDHFSPYWRTRNIIENVKGSNVPLFVTQGMTENNTAPDGLAEFLVNHTGPERGWLGPWNHVRGAELDNGKLAMGRQGFYDEVMSFYDQYLAGEEPTKNYAPFAIQSVTTGVWRPEAQWPPADATTSEVTKLRPGTYSDTGQSTRTDDTGVWTVSEPLPYSVHTAGAGTVTVDVSSPTPRSNLVVDVYDLDANGTGPLVARNGSLIRNNGRVKIDLMSADWRFAKGHRIGIRVTDTNTDWWVATVPTLSNVTVYGGEVKLPFLTYNRSVSGQDIQGASGTTRAAWMSNTATAPAEALENDVAFSLPPALATQPEEMKAQLDAFE